MSCKCQRCGEQYRTDLNVPDEMWVRIKPLPSDPSKTDDSAGLLCGPCIMTRIESLGGYAAWSLVKEGDVT